MELFLFWLFLIGIIIASLQDLKRREVDNWLNLFLIFSSISFIFYKAILENNPNNIFQMGFLLVLLFVVMNLFYYGRVFAGGDAKLLFALGAFFLAENFFETISNLGVFVFFLMVSGSVYGIVYSFILYLKDYKKVNGEIKREFSSRIFLRYIFFLGLILLFFGYSHAVFLILSITLLLFPLLYLFAKGLEKVSMIRSIPVSKLREGDWLVEDVYVGKKIIKENWEGLTLDEIEILQKKNKVKIRDGLPFVPAFLIAFLLYSFFKDAFLGIF